MPSRSIVKKWKQPGLQCLICRDDNGRCQSQPRKSRSLHDRVQVNNTMKLHVGLYSPNQCTNVSLELLAFHLSGCKVHLRRCLPQFGDFLLVYTGPIRDSHRPGKTNRSHFKDKHNQHLLSYPTYKLNDQWVHVGVQACVTDHLG